MTNDIILDIITLVVMEFTLRYKYRWHATTLIRLLLCSISNCIWLFIGMLWLYISTCLLA